MKEEKINISVPPLKVLVVPLDWGLGHVTRCIPIIRELLRLNCEVVLAASGASRSVLQQEFPQLTPLPLVGYNIRYSREKLWMPLTLLVQLPKLILAVWNEHRWIKKTIKSSAIDAVISDNRLGCHVRGVPSIYITHQLTIKTGNRFTEKLTQIFHYHFINKYNRCWVPDTAGDDNMSGALSHPACFPKTVVQYIGPLSRFEKSDHEKKYVLTVILSGPEPQRTIFESLLLAGLKGFTGKVIFVRGVWGIAVPVMAPEDNIEIHDHLSATELNVKVLESNMIIARCGYSTVMDLLKLNQKAILVPTPGQTEQEYLAKYLMEKKLFYCTTQNGFVPKTQLALAETFPFSPAPINTIAYLSVIGSFIAELRNGAFKQN